MLMGNISPMYAKPLHEQPQQQQWVTPPGHAMPYSSLVRPGSLGGQQVAQAPPQFFPPGASSSAPSAPDASPAAQVYVPAEGRSDATHGSSAHARPAVECKGGEAECTNQEECGGDDKGPRAPESVCGLEKGPLLPLGLGASTVVGGVAMFFLQAPMLSRVCQLTETQALVLTYSWMSLYGLTLLLMVYTAVVDAGQVRNSKKARNEEAPPRRSHKTWLYKRPVRRFDHYCRWLTNSIALMNHREFVLMLVGLTLVGLLGLVVDTWLAVVSYSQSFWSGPLMMQAKLVGIILHLSYSLVLLYLVLPILHIHVGFISRNELAKECNQDIYRVLAESRDGRKEVPVDEVSSDEYNEKEPGDFVYMPSKNPYDNGCCSNCAAFWCHSRWQDEETGDF